MSKNHWNIQVDRNECPYVIYPDITRCTHRERDMQKDGEWPRCTIKDCPIKRV